MDWARVVRGINSTENAVTPVAADFCIASASLADAEIRLTSGLAEQREVGLSVDVVGAIAEDLSDDVRFGEDCGAVGDGCAFFCVLRVGVSGGCAGSGFYYYFKACFRQRGNDDGDEGYAALAGIVFFGDADDHAISSFFNWNTVALSTINVTLQLRRILVSGPV